MRKVWLGAACAVAEQQAAVADKYSRELRRADQFVCLAVSAADAVMEKFQAKSVDRRKIGLFLGTAFGSIETGFRFLDSILDDGEQQASPTLFSHSVHNVAAGYIAKLLDVRGPVLTLTTFSWPFLSALQQAGYAVACGAVEAAIALAVEVRSALMEDAAARIAAAPSHEGAYGAVAWLLQAEDRSGSQAILLERVEIEERSCAPDSLLLRKGETFSLGKDRREIASPPMGYAFSLTEEVNGQSFVSASLHISLEAPFGKARLFLDAKNSGKADR